MPKRRRQQKPKHLFVNKDGTYKSHVLLQDLPRYLRGPCNNKYGGHSTTLLVSPGKLWKPPTKVGQKAKISREVWDEVVDALRKEGIVG